MENVTKILQENIIASFAAQNRIPLKVKNTPTGIRYNYFML